MQTLTTFVLQSHIKYFYQVKLRRRSGSSCPTQEITKYSLVLISPETHVVSGMISSHFLANDLRQVLFSDSYHDSYVNLKIKSGFASSNDEWTKSDRRSIYLGACEHCPPCALYREEPSRDGSW